MLKASSTYINSMHKKDELNIRFYVALNKSNTQKISTSLRYCKSKFCRGKLGILVIYTTGGSYFCFAYLFLF